MVEKVSAFDEDVSYWSSVVLSYLKKDISVCVSSRCLCRGGETWLCDIIPEYLEHAVTDFLLESCRVSFVDETLPSPRGFNARSCKVFRLRS